VINGLGKNGCNHHVVEPKEGLNHRPDIYAHTLYPHRDGEGFLLVYSITSRSTFDRIERFRDQIFRVKDVDNVPLMLVGNKCDKVTERDVHREEGYAMAKRLGCDFIETSAKTCVNVERSFYQVVKTIRAQREGLRAGTKSKPKKDKKSKCLIL
jgi:GTPase KRas protein